MTVLITGAAGFVGRHLAAACADRGLDVVGIGRGSQAPEGVVGRYITAELNDEEATVRAVRETAPEVVFHLAAEASVADSWERPAATIASNTTSSVNVLEAVRRHAPEASVLVAGSGEVYGAPAELPVRESAARRPRNPYALSKAAVEQVAEFYADVHGMRVFTTRAFNHAGPGQSDTYVVASFARQIATAEAERTSRLELLTGDLRPRRDFTDVRDVVRAYLLVVEAAEPGVYNVCAGRSTAIADILAGLARHTDLEVEQKTDPARVREHEVMDIHGSNERLTEATGWSAEIPLERTLGDTLDWWREQVREGVAR